MQSSKRINARSECHHVCPSDIAAHATTYANLHAALHAGLFAHGHVAKVLLVCKERIVLELKEQLQQQTREQA